jgi:hypothetical protein
MPPRLKLPACGVSESSCSGRQSCVVETGEWNPGGITPMMR